jgi:hypothetical protein
MPKSNNPSKMTKTLTSALLSFASVALLASSANAQSTITSVPYDVVLGFRATSGTGAAENVEVDLGSITQFYNTTPGEIIHLNSASQLAVADLVSTYGSAWASDPNLFWGVAATNQATSDPTGRDPVFSLWATDPEITPGTLNTPWRTGSRAQQGTPASNIASLYTGLNGATSTTNSSMTSILPTAQGDSWTAEDEKLIGTSFGYFNPTIDNAVTNVNGSGNSISDFYELLTTNNINQPGTVLGKFELNSNGTFEFIAAAPVPEPSSMGLMGVGFLSLIGMVVLRRRRSVLA